ncbi:MAG: hypothetical protein WB791_05565 [Waddliaceae bacterium]
MNNQLFLFIFLLFFSSFSLQLLATEGASSVAYPVGELAERWEFPSDHLPIGVTVGNHHFAEWNVLDTKYINYIEGNSQGLHESLIITANVPVAEGSPLTVRESMIIDQVIEMIEHPTHPRSLIALQETGSVFFEEFQKKLPDHMACVTVSSSDLSNGDIFIYDTNIFEWNALHAGHYQGPSKNTYMTLTLREKKTDRMYHFVQSHLSGNPKFAESGRKEFAEKIIKNFDPASITVIMGDMNHSPDLILTDFQQAAKRIGLDQQPFINLWIPYPTHIDTYKRASWIDNFFLYNPYDDVLVSVSRDGESLTRSVGKALDLLKCFRPYALEVSFEAWCQLKMRNLTIISGAPSSGKTMQTRFAFADSDIEIFDLKKRFLDDYYAKHQIFSPEEQSQIRLLYRSDDSFNALEYEWLIQNKASFLNTFLASSADLILFDEFDLTIGSKQNSDKISTLLEIADMTKHLIENHKKAILIVHNDGLTSPILWEQLHDKFSIYKENVVTTKYLGDDEELYLLGKTLLSEMDRKEFMNSVRGAPPAYVTLIKTIAHHKHNDSFLDISSIQLMKDALFHVKRAWAANKRSASDETIDTLKQIALEEASVEDLSKAVAEELLTTGLIGVKHGKLVMPPIVKNAILSDTF